MILKYFADYIQQNKLTPNLKVLILWVKSRLDTPPTCHEDKVIQAEIYIAKNFQGEFCLIGKSETGRNLINSLYNYVLSCQNLIEARQKHNEQND